MSISLMRNHYNTKCGYQKILLLSTIPIVDITNAQSQQYQLYRQLIVDIVDILNWNGWYKQ